MEPGIQTACSEMPQHARNEKDKDQPREKLGMQTKQQKKIETF